MSEPREDPVPIFGTWPRIYGAVVILALVVMAFAAFFSKYPF